MLPSETLQEVREIFERCQRRYPTISLAFEPFLSRVEEIVAAVHREHSSPHEGRTGARSLSSCAECLSLFRQLHHEDLFLAIACARGDRIAWEYFADNYLALLRRFAAHACRSCEASEDLAQEIVTILLGESLAAVDGSQQKTQGDGAEVAPGNPAPGGKLQGYNGRGSLAGWLRAAVSHAAIDRFRRERKQVSLDEMLEQGGMPDPHNRGPANDADERLDSHWAPILSRALEEEISRLCARDRLLLSLYYVQGVPLKNIGRQFGVHEATASRWLERLRRGVRKGVERKLRKTHRLSPRELTSLWHWVSDAEGARLEPVLRLGPEKVQPRKKVQGGTV